MDPLTITILIIFGTTLIATILQRRAKDPCLKKFHGHLVFVQLKNGKWIWGRLHVYAKSLELEYEGVHQDKKGHSELSYLLFESHLEQIQIILRPSPKQGSIAFRRWELDLHRIITPSIWFNFRRSCRNVWNTLRDAFAQSVGVVVGQLRAKNPSAILGTADQQITTTGQKIVAFGSNAYEPILEKYLGKDVVVEIMVGEQWIEQVGLLEEYSDKFVLARDVSLHMTVLVPEELGPKEHIDIAFPRAHSVVRHLAKRKH
jgi:small nuclear ribonucleoprotein (snRNP)-like protein